MTKRLNTPGVSAGRESGSRNETPEERALKVLRHFEVLVSKRYNGSISVQAYSEEVDRLVKVLCATPSETAITAPDTVIAKIIKDIRGRKGIGDEWEQIDVDIRSEIAAEWRTFFTETGDKA